MYGNATTERLRKAKISRGSLGIGANHPVSFDSLEVGFQHTKRSEVPMASNNDAASGSAVTLDLWTGQAPSTSYS
jgi:hypothetical protein